MTKLMARFQVESSFRTSTPLMDQNGKFNPIRFTWWDDDAADGNQNEPVLFEVVDIAQDQVKVFDGSRISSFSIGDKIEISIHFEIKQSTTAGKIRKWVDPNFPFTISLIDVEKIEL
jgi:hypothetical protein